ncbi:MAG: glycosyltransferase [Cyanothece sp. SIO1E1]|nr:glycosyltransferase [Cyanothece sp. SIO1E1]
MTDWFSPAYKAGGPIRSCVNLAKALKNNFQVYVLSTNFDAGERGAVLNVSPNHWIDFENKIKIKYLSRDNLNLSSIERNLEELQPDAIYLNSMFSLAFTIYPLIFYWTKKQSSTKIILAPRGMLQKGALQYKSIKKKLFLFLFRSSGLTKRITFQATDLQELKDISNLLRIPKEEILLLENLPEIGPNPLEGNNKKKNVLKLIFISRISAKKNLTFLLSCLKGFPSSIKVDLSIYGPIESQTYWQKCKNLIADLPTSVDVTYRGSIKHELVRTALQKHHFLVLLTHGENFGHVIFEAFSAGIPVIISDQTPWVNLKEKNIGWDIPLEKKSIVQEILVEAAEMETNNYIEMSKSARRFAEKHVEEKKLVERYCRLFNTDDQGSIP